MTIGQERALRELKRLQVASIDEFKIIGSPQEFNGKLVVEISLHLGPMELREGGLDLREREDFIVIIPPDFPFDLPTIKVPHERFARFPHVIWAKTLCLYQSKLEWNPSDGLYGFFDRLKIWLGRAAINDMDPVEGPLEPPHYVTDFSQVPFVIRSDVPVSAGESWFGLAELENHSNRVELVGWNDLTGEWPAGRIPALTLILEKPMPPEFPEKGGDFFRELLKNGLDRDRILKNLALASLLTPKGESIHLIFGIPMRRAADGTPRIHIAVWTTSADFSDSLRNVLPEGTDSDKIRSLRRDLSNTLYSLLELTDVKWCRVLEDRKEIVVRRDVGCPMGWFSGKKVLILGCGALGSWAAEALARANASSIHLVDNSIVHPGLLVRQNYQLTDIGHNKAEALANRLLSFRNGISIQHFNADAHTFLMQDPNRIRDYDVVLDFTASSVFQMKLERDWGKFARCTPKFISMVIDAKAQRCLCVVLSPNSIGGVWDSYLQLKHRLCIEGSRHDVISAFYSNKAIKDLFQPEPGCSDLTFSGSAADVSILALTGLNIALGQNTTNDTPIGVVFSSHGQGYHSGILDIFKLSTPQEITVGQYRVRITPNVYREVSGWVQQNDRIRTRQHETGGLLWGLWDDAINVIWVFDASGPPPDSQHNPAHFACGVEGTFDEHNNRFKLSRGTCGFIGFWHTHPEMPSQQSLTDMHGMARLVSGIGQNQKRAMMIIFGRTENRSTAGIYTYESQSLEQTADLILVGEAQTHLETVIV